MADILPFVLGEMLGIGGSGFWRVASRRADLADILTLRTAMTANLGTDVVVRSRTLCPGKYLTLEVDLSCRFGKRSTSIRPPTRS